MYDSATVCIVPDGGPSLLCLMLMACQRAWKQSRDKTNLKKLFCCQGCCYVLGGVAVWEARLVVTAFVTFQEVRGRKWAGVSHSSQAIPEQPPSAVSSPCFFRKSILSEVL